MQAQTRPGHNDVIAEYPDMASARKAIDALEFSGLDARHITLDGKRAREIARQAPKNTVERDRGLVRHIAFRAVSGAAIGATAGAVLGVLIGNLGVGWLGTSVAATGAFWGVGGLLVGALVGAYSALTIGDAWESTFEPARPGTVIVSVHTDTADDVDRAATILSKHQAVRISRF